MSMMIKIAKLETENQTLREALEAVLDDASHTGKWNSHGPIERETWEKAGQALGYEMKNSNVRGEEG